MRTSASKSASWSTSGKCCQKLIGVRSGFRPSKTACKRARFTAVPPLKPHPATGRGSDVAVRDWNSNHNERRSQVTKESGVSGCLKKGNGLPDVQDNPVHRPGAGFHGAGGRRTKTGG